MDKRSVENLARRYITERRLSLVLGNSIMHYLKRRGVQVARPRLHGTEIPSLKLLPIRIKRLLKEEVFSPLIVTHPLFNQIKAEDVDLHHSICHTMTEESITHGDEIFNSGMTVESMIFITGGEATYEFLASREPPAQVGVGEWLCEAVLWSSMHHTGRLTVSSGSCELLKLNAARFHVVVTKCVVWFQLKRYARLFVKRASRDSTVPTRHISDIWGNFTTVKQLTVKAFGLEHDTKSRDRKISSLLVLFDSDEVLQQHVFGAWKRQVQWQ
eukprot:CAMPEP_0170616268 /NCGR_PEP_ID=MMETSP0224-20130122/25780_1 /TAXON_ID=285029 /ORGANISM="Togula jolla, Strain CCCM 725" /LENGTH=270 /DNA_ID=CAMNT_0010942055 /DNA_START=166 /DNA_END=975 /DNA_ORIENTATION=+